MAKSSCRASVRNTTHSPVAPTAQTEKTKDRCAATASKHSFVRGLESKCCKKCSRRTVWPLRSWPDSLRLVVYAQFGAEPVRGCLRLDSDGQNDLDGETIHQACSWQGAGKKKLSAQKFLDLSAKALQWRWLIIDEISVVSAELLARLEVVRDLARMLAYMGA